MIDASDLADAQESYAELLASEVAQSATLQRPNRSQDSTGAANAADWDTVVSNVKVLVEEISTQAAPFTLRSDAEVQEQAYVVFCGIAVGVRPGDRWIVSGVQEPFEVRTVPQKTLDLVKETMCVQVRRLSDRV